MIIPIRCFTCGKVIANLWEKFYSEVKKQEKPVTQIFEEIGIQRYCCRRMMISHVDLIKYISAYDLPTEATAK